VRAVLVDERSTIVAGHHVTKAARSLGWTHVAAIPAEFASAEDRDAYLITDNYVAGLGDEDHAQQRSLMEDLLEQGKLPPGWDKQDVEDLAIAQGYREEKVRTIDLQPHPKNYREHDDEQLAHIERSLKEHGFYRAVVVANDGTILAGHGLVEAARKAGLNKVPVRRLDCGPDDPAALKVLAGDNEIGLGAGVDPRKLTEMLGEVKRTGDADALFGTGYTGEALANLLLVTRPETEVADFDAAAEWVGLPEFRPEGPRIQLVLSFDSEEARDGLINELGVTIAKHNRHSLSAWYPPRPTEDISSVRFESGDAR
jgi:hypothetical protein